MNEIIENQKHIIGTSTEIIFTRIEKIAAANAAYRTEAERLAKNQDYSVEAKERQKHAAANSCGKTISGLCDEISNEIQNIEKALNAMSSVFETGSDLQNALNIIKLGEDLPNESRYAIAEQFRGQPQALKIIAAALEQQEIPAVPYTSDKMFNAESESKKLFDGIELVRSNKPGDDSQNFEFARSLDSLAKRVGADNRRHVSDLDGLEGGLAAAIRKACGLG